MIKLYIYCLVLFIGILIVGPDIDIKFLHGDNENCKHDTGKEMKQQINSKLYFCNKLTRDHQHNCLKFWKK